MGRRLVFVLSVLSISMMMAGLVHSHDCAHSKLSADQHVYTIPQPHQGAAPWGTGKDAKKQSEEDVKRMHEQAFTAFPPAGWRKIRINVNYTYAADPSQDVYPDGKKRTCSAADEEIPIGGEATSTNVKCIDPTTGALRYTNYCWLKCRGQDVVNATSLAQSGSILETLKASVTRVLTKFEGLLAVPTVDPDYITVSASKSNNNCGDLIIPSHDVSAKDFELMVTLRPLHMLGETLAFARSCALNQATSRPILGHMNVAPATLINNRDLDTVLLHELTHALGFSPSLFKFFRHPSNRSQTYWQYDRNTYPNGPVKGDGIDHVNADGNFEVDYRKLGPGKKLSVVTPNVIAFGRNYFDCATLTGVELENGGSASSSTASHWEKRTLYYEYMTATQNLQPGAISGFSLNFLKDTGFYEINTAGYDTTMDWGKNGGCSWAEGSCKDWPSNYFCSIVQEQSTADGGMCSYNREWNGVCNLRVFTTDMPTPYQYFTNARQGGYDEFADRCPIVSQYANNGEGRGDCLASNNYPIGANPRRVKTGPTSRCFKSFVGDNRYQIAQKSAGCFEVLCADAIPQVQLGDAYYPCQYDDQKFELVTLKRLTETEQAALPADAVPTYNVPATTESTWYPSYSSKGVMECGKNVMAMCSGASTSRSPVTRVTSWPNITSMTPASDTVLGGTLVTVGGIHLHRCYGITVGGQWVTNISKVSSASWTVTIPPAGTDTALAGPYPDGTGPVMVELWCNITESNSCPNGCGVSRLTHLFNYTEEVTVPFSAADWLKGFIDTPAGKAVGGGIGAIILILAIIVIKSFCEGGEDKRKKGKGRGKGQRKGGQRNSNGLLHAPTPAAGAYSTSPYAMQPRSRMSQYEDDLL